jgi:fructoselysine 6-kinase
MRVVGIGDNVVDRYLSLGQMFPGGNALNVAVFARRAGAEAAYIGAIGTDAAGHLIRQALRQETVDASRLRVIDGPTAYADVAVVDGDRRFVGSSLGVSRFVPDAGDLALLRGADLIHSSTYSGLDEWVVTARAELPLSFDFSDRIDRAYVRRLAPGLVCALFSGPDLSPHEAETLVRWAVALGARTALVTRGAQGVIACLGDRCWTQPARPVEVVDTLGAGDAFMATFLVAHLRGAAPPEALARAAAAAAAACSYHGAFGGGGPIDGDLAQEPVVVAQESERPGA